MATAASPLAPPAAPDLKMLWPRLALFVSVVGVVGSLYLSMGMEMRACPLCFYQRAFMMAVAAILAFGLALPDLPRGLTTEAVLRYIRRGL